ncbi:caspase family protein [Myxococcaceae bacterium GXIMD 01537]
MNAALVTAALVAGLAAVPASPPVVDERTALFALIIGSNKSHDAELPALRYADDDAARYLDLFRQLGARTYLLSRLDENTRRLHPQASAEALEPRKARLDEAVRQLQEDIAQARQRGVRPVVYFVFAGHGNVRNGEGYISLEDAPLTGKALARDVLGRLEADRIHLIVDACYSYFLAYSRGPGGQRRPVSGFTQVPELAQDARIGLLLSTSSARESHEWENFQSGVFHHEVRSGLFGAADADGDGRVSYREIAAFVERANAAIPNDRFRPEMHTRPPEGSDLLVDLRAGLERRLEVDGTRGAHYLLEDAQGVRLAEFHNAAGQPVRLLRPAARGSLFLRRVADDREYPIPAGPEVVNLGALSAENPRVAMRGAAHEAFGQLFSLPFDAETVSRYRYPPPPSLDWLAAPASSRRPYAYLALGGGVAAGGAGLVTTLLANGVRNSITPNTPQQQVAERNTRISRLNTTSTVLYAVGGAAVLTGLLLLALPEDTSPIVLDAAPTPGGAAMSVQLGW